MQKRAILSRIFAAEDFTHHYDELQGAWVTDPIVNPVGILAGKENLFVAKDCKVLGDVALGSADCVNNVLDAGFFTPDHAKDLETKWVGNRLQCPCGSFNMALIGDEFGSACFHR